MFITLLVVLVVLPLVGLSLIATVVYRELAAISDTADAAVSRVNKSAAADIEWIEQAEAAYANRSIPRKLWDAFKRCVR